MEKVVIVGHMRPDGEGQSWKIKKKALSSDASLSPFIILFSSLFLFYFNWFWFFKNHVTVRLKLRHILNVASLSQEVFKMFQLLQGFCWKKTNKSVFFVSLLPRVALHPDSAPQTALYDYFFTFLPPTAGDQQCRAERLMRRGGGHPWRRRPVRQGDRPPCAWAVCAFGDPPPGDAGLRYQRAGLQVCLASTPLIVTEWNIFFIYI